MSSLFHRLRIHQVFGANTDVGKTLLTTALVRASAALGRDTFYLKPASTGPMVDADDEFVNKYTSAFRQRVQTRCLFRFKEPVSPHLAARLEQNENSEAAIVVPSDEAFVGAITNYIRQCAQAAANPSHMYVETAGGVHSPTLSGTTQVDSYRPLFLPTILIGDHKLGGISATISSYESLLLRGYTVDAVLVLRDEYYRNWEYLQSYFGERGLKVAAIDAPPEKHADPEANYRLTEDYYQGIVPQSKDGALFDVVNHLDSCHFKRLEDIKSMPRRTLDTIWWPFVQHGIVNNEKDVTVIDSAHGDMFSVYNGHRGTDLDTRPNSLLEPQFDGSASWWTQALGHAHPSLTLAAARAAGRYGHVMFPQGTHRPALELAERMVNDGPGKGWASRAFISDNGSTGMEVALKMALRAFAVREAGADGTELHKRRGLGILGLKGSYHGDTIGAMDACEEGIYTCEWHEEKGYWFDPPSVSIRKGKVHIALPPALARIAQEHSLDTHPGTLHQTYDMNARLDSGLAVMYRQYIYTTIANLVQKGSLTLAALVLEPIVMGAGGMIFVDPLFQRVLIDVVRNHPLLLQSDTTSGSGWSGLPVIYDEVFVGLYRIGLESSSKVLGTHPDISVHAKILTGGLVPLAVTMASDAIFQAFYTDKKADALLHGHSYTAYPIGCEVANETLSILDKISKSEEWAQAKSKWQPNVAEGQQQSADSPIWSFWDPEFVHALSNLDVVGEVMTLGTVLAFKVADDTSGYQSHSAQQVLESIRPAVADGLVTSPAPGGVSYGINYRTLGNVAYFMLSLNTPAPIIRSVEDKIWKALCTAKR